MVSTLAGSGGMPTSQLLRCIACHSMDMLQNWKEFWRTSNLGECTCSYSQFQDIRQNSTDITGIQNWNCISIPTHLFHRDDWDWRPTRGITVLHVAATPCITCTKTPTVPPWYKFRPHFGIYIIPLCVACTSSDSFCRLFLKIVSWYSWHIQFWQMGIW